MIEKVRLKRFKQFRERDISISKEGVSLIAGANNSGKSTILHALAVWSFCKTILQAEKGYQVFLSGTRTKGHGLADDEFSPILVPSLAHLWTNLAPHKQREDPDGYTLRISIVWRNNSEDSQKELQFGLALANNRLFVKPTYSNLSPDDEIPKIAYLPPLSGVTDREAKLPEAIQRRRIGEGLSGAVLRNILLDLYINNQQERSKLRGNKRKISDTDLYQLRTRDPWEILQNTLRSLFRVELRVKPFREEYHSYIKVEVLKVEKKGQRYHPIKGYKPRDLMVEGSGFLQWVIVYALATSSDINVLLLDEPDAHLHTTLQSQLINRLEKLAIDNYKQVFVATHSTDLIRESQPSKILQMCNDRPPRFLSQESQKVGLMAGLGSNYAPKVDKIKETKRIIFVEGEFDVDVLRKVAYKKDLYFPECWIEWVTNYDQKSRRLLFEELYDEVQNLIAISIQDRDDESIRNVDENLNDKNYNNPNDNIYVKKWKRRNIESYILYPPALAATSEKDIQEITDYLQREHGVAIQHNDFYKHEQPRAIADLDGKTILKKLNLNRIDVLNNIPSEMIPEDLINMLRIMQDLE